MSMSSSLYKRAQDGAVWSAIDAMGARFVQFVIGMILARLLLPEQFGLIGMLAIFMAVAQALLTSGFGAALIQKAEVTPADTSSVFYFNLGIGVILTSALWGAAPWIAAFYDQPILTPLTRMMSLVMVIDAFSVVQTVMLTRHIDFRTQTKVGLVAGLLSGVIAVGMAYHGFGVWSLAGQQLSAAVFRAVLLWLCNPWRPGLVFSGRSLRSMFTFGSRLLISSVLNQIFTNIYYVVVGRLFSPATLGFYTRARRLEELPSMTLSSIVTRVSFPVFSSIQDDAARLKRGLRRALTWLVFVNCPVMIGMAATARPLIKVVLTDKWLPCVPYLQLLCIAGLLLPLDILNLNLLVAKGRSDLFLRLEILKKVLTIVNIAVMWRWGVSALILGQAGLSCIACYLNSYYTGKLIGYPLAEQVRDTAPCFVCGGLMGIAVYSLEYVVRSGDVLLLVAQTATGVTAYLLLCGALRVSVFAEIRHFVARKMAGVRDGSAVSRGHTPCEEGES